MTTDYLLSTQFWWLLSLVVPLAVGLYAHLKVTGAYAKYSKIPAQSGLTGRAVAEEVLRRGGISNVKVVEIPGELTDHYDPTKRVLALSSANYNGSSLAALGVSAHEAGHALQHKEGYWPMNVRMGLVPTVQIAGNVLPFIMLGGFAFGAAGGWLLDVGIACYLAITLFHLVTLPVEFDASARAKLQLQGAGMVTGREATGVNQTLDAAGFTYVAAFLASILNLIYLVMLRRDRE